MKALRDQERKKKLERVIIMQKIPLFTKLTKTFIQNKLSSYFHEVNTIRGQFLFKQGDEADKVFIILNGEFLVTKNTEKEQEE